MIRAVKRGFDALGRTLCPARCVICGNLLRDESMDMHPACRIEGMIIMPDRFKIPHVKSWVPLWNYEGNVRQSLIRYKFYHRRGYYVTYGRELAEKIRTSDLKFDRITWVPVSWLRRRTRTYDQVELIAGEVGRHLGMQPVKMLHKHRHNRKQAKIMSKKKRLENVKGVYRAVNPENFKGKRVLLIDDILTTGATVGEAARVLKEAGAREVSVACVAAASERFFIKH